MTENEALNSALEKVKQQKINFGFMERFNVDENWEVMKTLEEIQQYRAIGTVEEFNRAKMMENVYGQIKWERDIAISQLEEIGVSLGQKMDEFKSLKEKLENAKEDIRKLLCSEYGSSCQFCIHDENEDAMCCNIGGSGSWCCKHARWKEH